MRTLKNKIALMVLLAGLSASAVAAPTSTTGADAGKTISSKIVLPESMKKSGYSEKVRVIFTVNEKGEVNHVTAVTLNAELRKTIEEQFSHLCFGELKANAANSVVLNFKVY